MEGGAHLDTEGTQKKTQNRHGSYNILVKTLNIQEKIKGTESHKEEFLQRQTYQNDDWYFNRNLKS